ncbi:hypothetical protein [Nostoc sp.]
MISSKVTEKETALLGWADTRSHPWQCMIYTRLAMVSIRSSDNTGANI